MLCKLYDAPVQLCVEFDAVIGQRKSQMRYAQAGGSGGGGCSAAAGAAPNPAGGLFRPRECSQTIAPRLSGCSKLW